MALFSLLFFVRVVQNNEGPTKASSVLEISFVRSKINTISSYEIKNSGIGELKGER
jgi:hypothetical protein